MLKIWVKGFRDDCVRKISPYFNLYKKKEWFNRPDVKAIIKDIDDTIAVKDEYLESPIFGGMSPEKLSNGCKALILMQVLDVNVYATRCGDNCVNHLLRIASEKDLEITLHHSMKFPDKFEAIMMDTGKEIHSREEFILEFYKINGIF